MFTEPNEECDEVLFGVHFRGPGLGEGSTFSICWGGPMNAIEASMNLCDDYCCIDGLPIDKSPLFKGSLEKGVHTVKDPDMARYENRDPRMKATLMLPGTSTVCILKWFIPEDTANEYDGSLDYYVIRYAEVLLSMADLYRWGEWEAGVKRMQHDKDFYGFGCYPRLYRGPQDDVWPIPQGEIDTNKQ